MKTVLVLAGGWTVLKEPFTLKEGGGAGLAVVGMMSYGFFASRVSTKPNYRVESG
jgi:drug/metabolite transporter (DMT)-like permease